MLIKAIIILTIQMYLCNANALHYKIPEYKVEVYHPRGFRVSIPNMEGIQLFAFHGNINVPMDQLYAVGHYYKDVLTSINDRWIYEDKVARVRKGDVLYFWLYVLLDGVGYRMDNITYHVKDVIRGGMPTLIPATSTGQVNKGSVAASSALAEGSLVFPCECQEKTTTMKIREQTTDNLQQCEQSVLNLTLKLITQQKQIETQTKTNDLLTNIIESRLTTLDKKLTLIGRISVHEDPFTFVKLILNEKLNLQPRIVSAVRNADESISFELSTINEMVQVILQAKDKLKNSQIISITYNINA